MLNIYAPSITCCELEKNVPECEPIFSDAISIPVASGKVDIAFIGYIIRQIDIIINEFYDKIRILNNQVELLQYKKLSLTNIVARMEKQEQQ